MLPTLGNGGWCYVDPKAYPGVKNADGKTDRFSAADIAAAGSAAAGAGADTITMDTVGGAVAVIGPAGRCAVSSSGSTRRPVRRR